MITRVPSRRPGLSDAAVGIVLLVVLAAETVVSYLAWRALCKSFTWVTVLEFVVPYLVGLCYLAVAVQSLLSHTSPSLRRSLALACAGVSLLASTRFAALTMPTVAPFWLAAWPLTALAFVYLAFAFHDEQASHPRSPWRHGVLALGVGLVLWCLISAQNPHPRLVALSCLTAFVSLVAGIVTLIGVLMHVRMHPSFIPLRLQAQAVLTGTLISFAPLPVWVVASIVRTLVSGILQFDPLRPLTYVPLLVAFPCAVAYALRYDALPRAESALALCDVPARMQSAISSLLRELADMPDPDSVCKRLVSGVSSLFHVHSAWAFLLSPHGDRYEAIRPSAGSDVSAQPPGFLGTDNKVVAALRQNGQAILLTPQAVADLGLSEKEQQVLADLKVELLVPLRSQGHLLGVLALGHRPSGDRYSEEEASLLAGIANEAAGSLERAQLRIRQAEQERRMIERTRRLAHILALGNEVKSLDRDIVVQKTVDTIQSSLGYSSVTLSLVEEDEPTRARIVAWAGTDGGTLRSLGAHSLPFIAPQDTPGASQVGECYFVCAPDTEQRLSTSELSVPWREGDQLLIPLIGNDGLIGCISADRPVSGLRPAEDELELMEVLANQVTVAIQNATLYASIDRALDERVAELATLHEIDRQINLRLSFGHVMEVTLEWAMRATSAVAGTLALVSENQQTLQVVAHRGYPPEMDEYWDNPWPIDEGPIGQVVRNAKPLLSTDLSTGRDYGDSLLRTRSHLVAPIMREDHVVGIISLEGTEPTSFTADHLAFLMRLADHAIIAIENARLYEETSRRVAELTALQRVSLDLTARLELGAVLDSIAANSRELTQADEIAIYLYDQYLDSLVFGAGLSQRGKESDPPIPIQHNRLTTTVVSRGQAIVIDSAQGHPLLANVEREVGAIASIPLRKADRVLGAFDIWYKKPHPFTSDELRTLNLLADQAAIAIDNAQLYAEAQRANESRDEFIGDASRVLRGLITPIQGYARLLAAGTGGDLTPQQRESVEVIVRNIEKMDRLINELLRLARAGATQIASSAKPVDVQRVIREAVRSISGETEARGQQIAVDIPRNLPGIRADAAQLGQLWTQLLVTLSQHTPPGSTLRVSARPYTESERSGDDQTWLLCTVEVPGLDIDHEEHARVFKPFYRLEHATDAPEEGIGLGLALVRAIVELHGGRIWLESKRGQGSTFYFTLPESSSSTP